MTDLHTAAKLALEALNTTESDCGSRAWEREQEAITALRQALEQQPADEPVAVKHMMQWVESLKRLSDNGQHMKIPSELSAGTCWELAIELEQFINTRPQPAAWVSLTDEEIQTIVNKVATGTYQTSDTFARAIEAKLKEKNNG